MLDLSARKVYGTLEDDVSAIDSKVDNAILSMYKAGGSLEFDDLPSPSSDVANMAYLVTDAFTTTSDFVEGAGVDYPAGTYVAIVNTGTEDDPDYKYDVVPFTLFVDDTMSAVSENPLQNKVITGAVQEIRLNISNLSASKISKSETVGHVMNDGSIDENEYAEKVENATSGHLAGLDSNGNLTDSGVSPTEEVTVEGNPVTFVSPFEQDAKSVVVSVKPIQDLHGLPFPYVGGAYKNKLPLVLADIKAANTSGTWSGNVYSVANGTVEILVDNANNVTGIKLNGTFTSQLFFVLGNAIDFEAGMKLNGWPSGVTNGALVMNNTANYDTGNGVTLTVSGNGVGLLQTDANATFSNAVVYPMLRFSTESDSTFAPYSNICPISGIDEVEIVDRGENFFANLTKDTSKGYIDNYYLTSNGSTAQSGGYYVSEYLEIKPNTAYYIGGILGNAPALCYYDSNKTYISGVQYANQESIIDTSPSNAKYMRLSVLKANESLYMVRYASAIVTTTIPLPSTLYDADVDVTDGDADENSEVITENDFTTISTPQTSYYGLYWTDIAIGFNPNGNFFCSHLPKKTGSQGWATKEPCYCPNDDGTSIRIYCFESTIEAFKQTYSGLKILYPLATPTTISLTPTDVELLEGTNVVTTNAEKVAVTYGRSLWQDIDDLKSDTEGKLDKSDVADVEGDTASKAYSVNEYMLRSDGFYRVTANIASGAAITSNNTIKVTVGGELSNKVNNDDSRLSDARMPSNNSLLLHSSGDEGYISGTKYFMNGNIAMAVDQFSASNTYEVGSYTVYQGQLYKCTVRHFESDWDSSHFAISNNIIVANGTIAAGTYESIGSDYAENFETLENCPVCRFVTLDGEKIRLAQPNDYILGVTSESPSVIGDSMKHGISVGLLGKLWVEHDGSAEINGYVISGENGIAIKSDKGYRVMAIDGNMAKLLLR